MLWSAPALSQCRGISLQATTWERPYGKHIPEILPRRVFAVRTEAAVWTTQLEELLDK